ncbi:MAG: HemK2/MTQ2 family protein methyltransferase [Candidatus Promineifilaceae bacterium]|nr:HemK2/MTQ2 family protein methyltransferase [Candidatus Promineifilaceae bacterium]
MKDTLLRRLHLTATRLRFHLFQRRRARRPILEQVAGYPIVVPPQVFNPRWFYSGDFLARTLNAGMITPVKEGQRVLDMGTGSGVVAVVAASLGARVVAVDVNPHAVRAARLNALLNDVEPSVDVREGDLFEPVVGEQFDLVVFNPPYLSGAPQTPFEQALYNTGVVERFSAGLATYLTPGGSGLVLLSTLADEASFLRCFAADGFSRSSVAEERLLAETLTLYRLIPQEARE